MPWRLQLRAPDGREVLTAALASAGTALIIIAAHKKLGDVAALLAPLALVLLVIVLMRPLLAVSLAIVVPILFEGASFGLFTFLAHVYDPVYKRLTPVDGLVLLAVVSVALDVLRDRRPLRYPRELRFPSILLALGMVSGIVVGKAGGNGLKSLVLAENLLLYLLLVPVAVANLKVDPARLRLLIAGFFGLAVFKAFLGLVEIGAHKGVSIEGSSNVTYYEPTANWVIMVALLGILAAVVARLRPPLWMLL